MTTNDIDAIRKLTDAATPGPWTPHTTYPHTVWQGSMYDEDPGMISTTLAHAMVADAEFIAAARTLVPALCDEVEQLRAYAETTRYHQQQHAEAVREIEQLRAKLAAPCGTCHPCTEWAIETWTQAGRKPPHVITWDDAQAELKALREVVEAAKVWRGWYTASLVRMQSPSDAEDALIAAVDALPNPADHLDICPGYGCPSCRGAEVAR